LKVVEEGELGSFLVFQGPMERERSTVGLEEGVAYKADPSTLNPNTKFDTFLDKNFTCTTIAKFRRLQVRLRKVNRTGG
jgi:hypothetical protein